MKTSELFYKAADIVERGWLQGHYYGQGRHCLVGAVNVASGQYVYCDREEGGVDCLVSFGPDNSFVERSLYLLASNYLHENVIQWNDKPERTKEEVVAMLHNAADVERIKEQAQINELKEEPCNLVNA